MLSKREKVLIAVLGSLLLHGIILFLFGLSLYLRPTPPAPVAEEQPIKLEITRDEPPEPQLDPLTVPQQRPMIDNPDSNAPAPTDPAFESNANSAANSELPATGTAPAPTQKGKKIQDFVFDTHDYTLGDKPAVNPSSPAQPPSPPSDAQEQPPQPTPPPKQDTAPPKPRVDRKAPRPPPTPAPTPLVDRDLFALLGPTPTPRPEPEADDNKFDPTRREPVTERPTPAVRRAVSPGSRPSNPGYQPMTQKTEMSGGLSISNRGPASVAALGTPMGRYRKAISDAIGSRWYYYIGQRSDIASFGTVKIHFIIDRSGAAMRPAVVSNTGNSTLENVSVQAITEATIPPMPAEVAALLNSNQMELDFSFSLVEF